MEAQVQSTEEATVVTEHTVACDGEGRGGHPRVYLTVAAGRDAVCPYCSHRFTLSEDAPVSGH